MRTATSSALVALCVFLAFLSGYLLHSSSADEGLLAHAQTVSGTMNGTEGQVVMASAQGPSSEPFFLLYEVASKRLAAYTVSKMGGIELRGVRELLYDLKLHDVTPPPAPKLTVPQAKALSEKQP